MRIVYCIIFLLTIAAPAAAEWSISTFRDDFTDRTYNAATMSSGPATLRVQCLNNRVDAWLTFERRIYASEVGASFRFDDRPVVPRFGFVTMSGHHVHIWNDSELHQIARSKRLRIQMSLPGADPFMLDFDLSGADKVIPKIRC